MVSGTLSQPLEGAAHGGSAEAEGELRRAGVVALAFDHSEQIAGLGSWEWSATSGELWWSDNHFRLFGLEPGEIVPTPEFVLARVVPEDRQRVEETIVGLAARRACGVDYRIIRADGAVRSLRATVATVDDWGTPGPILGSVQDVTLERRVDCQLAAHSAVTRALDEWASLQSGAESLLAGLSAAMEFAFGVFWVPDGSSLAPTVIWHAPSALLAAMAEMTRRWRPGVGSPTVGRAFATRQAVVSPEATDGGPRERNLAMDRAGIRGALAVPAVHQDEALAVFEFLSFEPIEPTRRLARTLAAIAHEVGHFLDHRRGELCVSALTPRELEVLQLAARGRPAVAIAGDLHLSPATIKRHFERAYSSLGVSDRAAAVGEAMRRGLIT